MQSYWVKIFWASERFRKKSGPQRTRSSVTKNQTTGVSRTSWASQMSKTMTSIVLTFVLLLDTLKNLMHFLLDIYVFQARTRELLGPRSRGPLYPRYINMLFNCLFIKINANEFPWRGFLEKSWVQFCLSLSGVWITRPKPPQFPRWGTMNCICSYFRVSFRYAKTFHFVLKAHYRRPVYFGLNFSISSIISRWSIVPGGPNSPLVPFIPSGPVALYIQGT